MGVLLLFMGSDCLTIMLVILFMGILAIQVNPLPMPQHREADHYLPLRARWRRLRLRGRGNIEPVDLPRALKLQADEDIDDNIVNEIKSAYEEQINQSLVTASINVDPTEKVKSFPLLFTSSEKNPESKEVKVEKESQGISYGDLNESLLEDSIDSQLKTTDKPPSLDYYYQFIQRDNVDGSNRGGGLYETFQCCHEIRSFGG